MFFGGFNLACEGDETRLHLECVPHTRRDFTYTTLHMWLRLRSTHPGASNRLDFVKLASVGRCIKLQTSQVSLALSDCLYVSRWWKEPRGIQPLELFVKVRSRTFNL